MKWFTFLKRLIFAAEPDQHQWKAYAKFLRDTAQKYGADQCPVILIVPEHCRMCGHMTALLMEPIHVCGECFQNKLEEAFERARSHS
jgi:hypothetical protein